MGSLPQPLVVTTSKERAVQDLNELILSAGYEFERVNKILIKPNVCGMYPPDIRLLEGTVEAFKPHAESLVIGETNSGMHYPEERFGRLGITGLVHRHGVSARNLLRDHVVRRRVPRPHALREIPLPSSLFEADLLVNVPGLGTHSNTLLTCAVKNLFGLIAVSSKYSQLHPLGVSEVLADLYQVVKPDLNIVDAGEKVLVGTDALGVDVVASEMKGLEPSEVKHLVLVSRDLGIDLKKLRVRRVSL